MCRAHRSHVYHLKQTVIMNTSVNAIKLVFSIKNNVLVPFRGQNEELTRVFRSATVKKANQDGYNEYTKKFIEEHNGSCYFVSDSYKYDSKNNTFNFYELHEASDSDLYMLSNCAFDINANYDFSPAYNEQNMCTVSYINKNIQRPSIEESGFFVSDLNWKYIVRNILKKKNTILVGPTGTGKTELIMNIAKRLNLDCAVYDMGAMQDPLTGLLGTHRLQDGNSVFDYSSFVTDVQKPGIILLDELSRAPQMAMNILFPCLDSRRELRIDIADVDGIRKVNVHPDCVFIATANIGAEYAGTSEIDAALFNRFLTMKLDYMPKNREIEVLVNRTGIDEQTATGIMDIASLIRSSYTSNVISKSISTRETLAIAELVVDGFSMVDAFDFIVCQKFMDEDEVVTVRGIVMGTC